MRHRDARYATRRRVSQGQNYIKSMMLESEERTTMSPRQYLSRKTPEINLEIIRTMIQVS